MDGHGREFDTRITSRGLLHHDYYADHLSEVGSRETPRVTDEIPRSSASRKKPRSHTYHTQVFYKCVQDGCLAAGFPRLGGYCNECHGLLHKQSTSGTLKSVADRRLDDLNAVSNSDDIEQCNNPLDYVDHDTRPAYGLSRPRVVTYRPPAHAQINEWEPYICSTPRCDNPTERTTDGLCRSCFSDKNRRQDGPSETFIETLSNVRPTATQQMKKICFMSGCGNEVCAHNENLCQECYDVLQESRGFQRHGDNRHADRSKSVVNTTDRLGSNEAKGYGDAAFAPTRHNSPNHYKGETERYRQHLLNDMENYRHLSLSHSFTSHRNQPSSERVPTGRRAFTADENPLLDERRYLPSGSDYRPAVRDELNDVTPENMTRIKSFTSMESSRMDGANSVRDTQYRMDNLTPAYALSAEDEEMYTAGRSGTQTRFSPDYQGHLSGTQTRMTNGPEEYRASSDQCGQEKDTYTRLNAEMERQAKGPVNRCRSGHCDNFGNTRCKGFCNSCFKQMAGSHSAC